MGTCSFYETWPGGLTGYDAWKLHSPYDDYDNEPEFECADCMDIGYDGYGDVAEFCTCNRPLDDDDFYEWIGEWPQSRIEAHDLT